MILVICLAIQMSCHATSRIIVAGAGDGSVEPQTVPKAVVYAENGVCRDEYPFCLSSEGFDDIRLSLADLRACEGRLEECQRAMDAIPSEVQVTVERVVVKETPWWNWFLIGVLAASIPVGIGVGYHFGDK